jgi:GNAT superfamily N-acetyltransferase
MPVLTEADLYLRGAETLLASWEVYASAATGAALQRHPGVVAAAFPSEPERGVYNNALLDRGLDDAARAEAIAAMESVYAEAGVTRFAAWVHESDEAMRGDLARRGYKLDEITRAMGMALDDIRLPRPEVDLAPADWAEYLRIFGLPPDLLHRADHTVFHLAIARLDGDGDGDCDGAAAALAFDFAGDCGIYNVGTVERARRRGLATALTALQVHDARARGCRTASLQSTGVAERVYAAVGFRDLGRVLEYVL